MNLYTTMLRLLACCVTFSSMSFGAAGKMPLPASKDGEHSAVTKDLKEPAAEAVKGFVLSNGEPVKVKEKGITITPPAQWEYSLTYPESTLLMQAPLDPAAKYRRTIQITSFSGAFYFTDADVADFEKKLVTRFSSGDSSIANFHVRNHMPVDLDGSLKAHLFYTDFNVGDAELMQMHVLVSSENRHFLVTYTDLAAYFEVDTAPAPHLNEAWDVMNSVKLETVAASPIAPAFNLLAVGGAILFVLLSVAFIRNRIKAAEYRGYADDKGSVLNTNPSSAYSAMPESIAPVSMSAMRTHRDDDDLPESEDLDFDDSKVKKAG